MGFFCKMWVNLELSVENAAANESPTSTLEEFAYSQEEKDMQKKYGSYADEIHTDLHVFLLLPHTALH